MKSFIFPKEILSLILVRILELEYLDKKKIIMSQLETYLKNMINRKFYRANLLNISVPFHTAIFINKYTTKYNIICPVPYRIIHKRIKDFRDDLEKNSYK